MMMGRREMTDSAIIMARATQSWHVSGEYKWLHNEGLTIQPRAPVVEEETGPGAQPRCFDSGESTAQPTSMPRFIEMVTGKPIMTPCPT
jgi:hypothetical protein